MQIPRMFGIVIDFGVPGIILGGLTFHFTHSWVAVWIFEIILAIIAVNVAFKAAGKPDPHAGH